MSHPGRQLSRGTDTLGKPVTALVPQWAVCRKYHRGGMYMPDKTTHTYPGITSLVIMIMRLVHRMHFICWYTHNTMFTDKD
jgi:hypothetical protein